MAKLTQGERLASMEVEVRGLKDAFYSHKADTNKQFTEVNQKLDDLLALRNKGAGAFWLGTSLMGIGLFSGIGAFFKWLMG